MKDNKYKILQIVAALVGLLAVMIVVILASRNSEVMKNNIDEPAVEIDGASGIVITDNKEKANLIDKIGESLDIIKNKNIFISVQDGPESFVTTIYNTDGEAFLQSSETGHITVYRKDNQAIRYTDYVDFGPDSNVIGLLENAYKMATENKTVVLTSVEAEKIDGFTQVMLDIRGWDQIEEFYNLFDPSFGKMMTQQLQHSLHTISEEEAALEGEESSGKELGGETVKSDSIMNFRFAFVISNETNGLESAACYTYLGDKASNEITWEDVVMSWFFEGYSEVHEWKLSEDWYTLDWTDISTWEDQDRPSSLIDEQYNIIVEMLDAVTVENGGESSLNTETDIDTNEEKDTDE